MLISAVMPLMSIYRLPHGQYCYSGHVINLPQDVVSFARSLPRAPSQLDVIVVRKEGPNESHQDFRVRRSVVHRALKWLLSHNIYYCANHVCIDQNALALLPEDGAISNLTSITTEGLIESESSDATIESGDPYDARLPQSFVPLAARSLTEQEAIKQSVEEL